MDIIFISIGGAFGAILRYILSTKISDFANLPMATLLTNIIGCFFLGWFLTRCIHNKKISLRMKVCLSTGFAGGLTTFSTFCVENAKLICDGKWKWSLFYILITIITGLAMGMIGINLGNRVKGELGEE